MITAEIFRHVRKREGFRRGDSHHFRRDTKDLNDLIPSGSGWVLTEAEGINEAGRIVGVGWLNGQQRGFLLTP